MDSAPRSIVWFVYLAVDCDHYRFLIDNFNIQQMKAEGIVLYGKI